MKKIIIVLMFLLMIFAITFAQDVDVKIDLVTDDFTFDINQSLIFDYNLTANQDANIVFLDYLLCPERPLALIENKVVQLKANESVALRLDEGLMYDILEYQDCNFIVAVYEPVQRNVVQKVTLNGYHFFDLEVVTCLDSECEEFTNTFVKGEDAFLFFYADEENVVVKASITDPNGKTGELVLPNKIEDLVAGVYEVEIVTSKEGFQDYKMNLQIPVLAEDPMIEYNAEYEKKLAEQEGRPVDTSIPGIAEEVEKRKSAVTAAQDNLFFIVAGVLAFLAVVLIGLLIFFRFRAGLSKE